MEVFFNERNLPVVCQVSHRYFEYKLDMYMYFDQHVYIAFISKKNFHM